MGGCAARGLSPSVPAGPAPVGARLLPGETPYLTDLRQLTFGGENAEAYWSFDGTQLSFQARLDTAGCDRIYRMSPASTARPAFVPVSSGKGATTCAHFFPSGDLLFSSTHLAGDACPPRPDASQGYVWGLHDSYDIFAASPDGSHLRPLTHEKGYDAEATVCGQDGSVIFTSTRDGDIDLYRMDRDGGHVKRLTHTPGYDGGAFFNRDCSKIVWRASRPRPGKELDDYRALLARGLVRPSKLELWIADADGSNPMQLTYLDAASFAPSFHPRDNTILFSSNYGDPKGREFDLWAIRPDGTDLRRITLAAGFDGFPHFSPDGATLAFSSNRATAPGQHDTNIFIAHWRGRPFPEQPAGAADRIRDSVTWLSDPEREGRGVGTGGLARAGAWLESQLATLGLQPAGDEGGFRQKFSVTTGVDVAPSPRLVLDGKAVGAADFSILGFSASGQARGPVVLAGYGLADKTLGVDDYAGLNVKGKVVLVRRFVPDGANTDDAGVKRQAGDLRKKAWLAAEHGATALLVTDWPLPPRSAPADWKPPVEAPLVAPAPQGAGDAGIPVFMVKRAVIEPLAARLLAHAPVTTTLEVSLSLRKTEAFNVVGRIPAGKATKAGAGAVILGAHYDHLGYGGRFSLAPDQTVPHGGADDNASGTAAVLEIARALMASRADLGRDVLVVLFSGEETGLLGSTHFVRARADTVHSALAMLNLDMVGRLRDNHAEILGSDSAPEWAALVTAACAGQRILCTVAGDGYGPSDQAAFYSAGLPVLHFFTGSHTDYHKPSDTADKINAAGAAAIAALVNRVIVSLDASFRLTYHKGTGTQMTGGDARSFSVSLGTIPDYAGPPGGAPGVLLSGVRTGGAAEKAGMQRGDILIRLGTHAIRSVEDLMFALNNSKAGDTVTAVILRDGKEIRLNPTFQEARPQH